MNMDGLRKALELDEQRNTVDEELVVSLACVSIDLATPWDNLQRELNADIPRPDYDALLDAGGGDECKFLVDALRKIRASLRDFVGERRKRYIEESTTLADLPDLSARMRHTRLSVAAAFTVNRDPGDVSRQHRITPMEGVEEAPKRRRTDLKKLM